MIIEHAEFTVSDPEEFEKAFVEARKVISQADGFHWAELSRVIERPNVYLLLVGWDSVEAHLTGFRESAGFAEWRSLVGPFFAEPPRVEHIRTVSER